MDYAEFQFSSKRTKGVLPTVYFSKAKLSRP